MGYSKLAWILGFLIWFLMGLAFALSWHAYFGDTYQPHVFSDHERVRNICLIIFAPIGGTLSFLWIMHLSDAMTRNIFKRH